MQRFMTARRILISLAALFCLLAATLGVTLFANQAAANTRNNAYVTLGGSFASAPAGSHLLGARASNQQLTITLVLQSGKAAQMNSLLANLYNPGSPLFHHWLKTGQFN